MGWSYCCFILYQLFPSFFFFSIIYHFHFVTLFSFFEFFILLYSSPFRHLAVLNYDKHDWTYQILAPVKANGLRSIRITITTSNFCTISTRPPNALDGSKTASYFGTKYWTIIWKCINKTQEKKLLFPI